MLKKLLFTLPLIGMIACQNNSDLEVYKYKVKLKNESGKLVKVTTYKNGRRLDFTYLKPSESILETSYYGETFLGYATEQCDFDSLKLEFPNGKGYTASSRQFLRHDSLSRMNPFYYNESFRASNDLSDDIENVANEYEFVISPIDLYFAEKIKR